MDHPSPRTDLPRDGSAAPAPVRVLVVDDERLVRTALTAILASTDGLDVVAAVDGPGAAPALARHHVDVVLCDVRMPAVDGLAVLRHVVRSPPPRPAVVMLTTFAADDLVADALRLGAAGYLLKDTGPEQLVDAVRRVAAGASVLSPEVTTAVIGGFLRELADPGALAAVGRLTAREREVLALMARGESNADIALQLHVSLSTVKSHVGAVLDGLGVANRVQAVLLAVRAGLASPPR